MTNVSPSSAAVSIIARTYDMFRFGESETARADFVHAADLIGREVGQGVDTHASAVGYTLDFRSSTAGCLTNEDQALVTNYLQQLFALNGVSQLDSNARTVYSGQYESYISGSETDETIACVPEPVTQLTFVFRIEEREAVEAVVHAVHCARWPPNEVAQLWKRLYNKNGKPVPPSRTALARKLSGPGLM